MYASAVEKRASPLKYKPSTVSRHGPRHYAAEPLPNGANLIRPLFLALIRVPGFLLQTPRKKPLTASELHGASHVEVMESSSKDTCFSFTPRVRRWSTLSLLSLLSCYRYDRNRCALPHATSEPSCQTQHITDSTPITHHRPERMYG